MSSSVLPGAVCVRMVLGPPRRSAIPCLPLPRRGGPDEKILGHNAARFNQVVQDAGTDYHQCGTADSLPGHFRQLARRATEASAIGDRKPGPGTLCVARDREDAG